MRRSLPRAPDRSSGRRHTGGTAGTRTSSPPGSIACSTRRSAESLDFRPLHQALRDPARNFLYDYLGLREDDPKNKAAITATPDCADLPYFLRAYFAWKLGLPFGFRDCDRGHRRAPAALWRPFHQRDAAHARQGPRWAP